MRKGQPVVVNGRTYASQKQAASSEGVASSTAQRRAVGTTAKPRDGSKWQLDGQKIYSDKVRTAGIMVVYKGMMYDSYTHAAECVGLTANTIRNHIIEQSVKNSHLLDSSCWRRVDPLTGSYVR